MYECPDSCWVIYIEEDVSDKPQMWGEFSVLNTAQYKNENKNNLFQAKYIDS